VRRALHSSHTQDAANHASAHLTSYTHILTQTHTRTQQTQTHIHTLTTCKIMHRSPPPQTASSACKASLASSLGSRQRSYAHCLVTMLDTSHNGNTPGNGSLCRPQRITLMCHHKIILCPSLLYPTPHAGTRINKSPNIRSQT
jgi:hypothetical protein